MDLFNINNDNDFNLCVIPEGKLLTYVSKDENGDFILKYKDENGNVGVFSGGIDTSDATASEYTILNGYTAYVNGEKITGKYTANTDASSVEPENVKYGVTYKNSNDNQIYVGTFTSDATAEKFDILEGKTAYVNGEKVTGVYKEVSEEDVRSGVAFGAYDLYGGTSGIPETLMYRYGSFTSDATAAAEDIAPGKTAYANGIKLTGAMPAKEAETYTPGTADITIKSGVYISEDQTIKGDAALTSENIKSGVSIFNVSGSFTSDATATAEDIASGKTAYVNGEKVVGTSTEGENLFTPLLQYAEERVFATITNKINTIQIPSNNKQNYIVYNNNLYYQEANLSKIFEILPDVNWSFSTTKIFGNENACYAIGDGKVYYVYKEADNSFNYRCLTPLFDNITQVMEGNESRFFFLSGTDLYISSEEIGKYSKVDGFSVSKIFNKKIDMWGNATIYLITTNGSLAVVMKESDDDENGNPQAYKHVEYKSDGDPFYSAFFDNDEIFQGLSTYTAGCWFALRQSGLWYIRPNLGNWTKVDNAPSFRKTDLFGYCLTLAHEEEIYDEENDDYYLGVSEPQQEFVALQIDTNGFAWKISSKIDNNGNFGGVELLKLDDSDGWQYVPTQMGNNETKIAQKNGKLIKLKSKKNSNGIIEITQEEMCEYSCGKLIANFGNNLFFAPLLSNVDITKCGGEYSV